MADAGKERARKPARRKRRPTGKTEKQDAARRGQRERDRAQARANLIWAIAHPLRRRILRTLADGDEVRSPMQISREFGIPVSAIAYHVSILRKFGALRPAGERMARGAVEHFYATTIENDPPIETLLAETRVVDDEMK